MIFAFPLLRHGVLIDLIRVITSGLHKEVDPSWTAQGELILGS